MSGINTIIFYHQINLGAYLLSSIRVVIQIEQLENSTWVVSLRLELDSYVLINKSSSNNTRFTNESI